MNKPGTTVPTFGRAHQVIDNLWRVGGGSWNGRTTALSAEHDGNVYLLRTSQSTILVDCATETGFPAIMANLDELGITPHEVDELVLTHSHWDHTEATARFQAAAPNARTHLNSIGAAFLEREDHRLIGYHVTPPPHAFAPFRVDHGVADNDRFELGTARVAAYHLPGHTPDSTLYTIAVEDTIIGFCGDVVFEPREHGGALLGQLCTLWLSNLDHYVESLRRLLDIRLDVLLPGHGDPLHGAEQIRSATQQTLEVACLLAADTRLRENLGV